jgi:hypothetical protein
LKLRLYLLFVLLLFCKAQGNTQVNLVPNPGFEAYDTCPFYADSPNYSGANQICLATPWFQPLNPDSQENGCGESSSDFYHMCAGILPKGIYGIGYQYPKTGNGFSGIGLYYPNNPIEGREYIEVPLLLTLKRKKHCVSWESNLAGMSGRGSNRIGAYFSQDTAFQPNNQFTLNTWLSISVEPQIENLAIVTDTQNWVPFHQSFMAQGGERFMTIGNFRDGELIESIIVDTTLLWPYYYFDDFGVYELPEISAGLGGEIDSLGENVNLQASCEGCWNDLVNRWWPSAGLNDTTILNPIATPEVTTTYYFGLIDTSETVPCIVDLVDSVTVFVTIPQDTVMPPPTSFSWLVYPSPTSGNLTLQFSALNNDSQLLIIDSRGRLVRKISIPKNTESFPLDISALAAGEYFLQVENSDLKEKRKITKY